MKYVVFDTETSGLFDFKLPADAEGQPRMASMTMIFVDENLEIEETKSFYIKPNGWVMNAETAAIHGLTQEFLMENGVPVEVALTAYLGAIEERRVMVAFNAQFDLKVVRGELRRAGMPDRFEETMNICVMRPMTKICNLPKANGKGAKFPKLAEDMAYFGHQLEDAHTATADAMGALLVMRGLVVLGELPEPAVHYAKEGRVYEGNAREVLSKDFTQELFQNDVGAQ